MKTVQLELPDPLVAELNRLIQSGWFRSEEEVLRAALYDFVQRNRLPLLEHQQLADVQWALSQAESRR
jgi:Arc/MetJ-type ribon-helix-helix transcriptional regulator